MSTRTHKCLVGTVVSDTSVATINFFREGLLALTRHVPNTFNKQLSIERPVDCRTTLRSLDRISRIHNHRFLSMQFATCLSVHRQAKSRSVCKIRACCQGITTTRPVLSQGTAMQATKHSTVSMSAFDVERLGWECWPNRIV